MTVPVPPIPTKVPPATQVGVSTVTRVYDLPTWLAAHGVQPTESFATFNIDTVGNTVTLTTTHP